MIEFRQFNYETDANSVIALINANLNKNYDLELLKWKHFENPYGKSLGAVALSDNKIIAIVFYMHYIIFSSNMEMIKCARPVDGCTALSFRKKGIFKKLMKFTLSEFGEDFRILFANPNKFSYPEFLKMNWSKHQKSYYSIGFPNYFQKKSKNEIVEVAFNESVKNTQLNEKEKFLLWRFKFKKYRLKKYLINDNEIVYVAYRITRLRRLKILILCDFIGDFKNLNEIVYRLCLKEKSSFIYYLNNNSTPGLNLIWSKNHKEAIAVYSHFESGLMKKIRFSLADLEGTT